MRLAANSDRSKAREKGAAQRNNKRDDQGDVKRETGTERLLQRCHLRPNWGGEGLTGASLCGIETHRYHTAGTISSNRDERRPQHQT